MLYHGVEGKNNYIKGVFSMTLVRWKPFREVAGIQDDINRLFDEAWSQRNNSNGLLVPPLDISESEDGFTITCDLPGVTKDEIDIQLHDGILTIKGEKQQETDEKKTNYHRLERVYGSFSRSLSLPTTIDPDKISGSYQDGVLKVTVGKREETKPKQIKVEVK